MPASAGVPILVVVSGPSGVGKDTLIDRLRDLDHALDCHFVVTATTRAPRAGEQEGVNHHFVDRREFERMIQDDELLEWASVYGNYYGVPRSQVRGALDAGKHVLLRVDVQGAARLRLVTPEAVFIFVMPPSLDSLRTRLKLRGKDSPESIATRLAAAEEEIARGKTFDYRVVNRDGALDDAARELVDIIHRESARKPPRAVRV